MANEGTMNFDCLCTSLKVVPVGSLVKMGLMLGLGSQFKLLGFFY